MLFCWSMKIHYFFMYLSLSRFIFFLYIILLFSSLLLDVLMTLSDSCTSNSHTLPRLLHLHLCTANGATQTATNSHFNYHIRNISLFRLNYSFHTPKNCCHGDHRDRKLTTLRRLSKQNPWQTQNDTTFQTAFKCAKNVCSCGAAVKSIARKAYVTGSVFTQSTIPARNPRLVVFTVNTGENW